MHVTKFWLGNGRRRVDIQWGRAPTALQGIAHQAAGWSEVFGCWSRSHLVARVKTARPDMSKISDDFELDDLRWLEMTWDDLRWLEMTWDDLRWLEMTWDDLSPVRKDLKLYYLCVILVKHNVSDPAVSLRKACKSPWRWLGITLAALAQVLRWPGLQALLRRWRRQEFSKTYVTYHA